MITKYLLAKIWPPAEHILRYGGVAWSVAGKRYEIQLMHRPIKLDFILVKNETQ